MPYVFPNKGKNKGIFLFRGGGQYDVNPKDEPIRFQPGELWDGTTYTGTGPGAMPMNADGSVPLGAGTIGPLSRDAVPLKGMTRTEFLAACFRLKKVRFSGRGVGYTQQEKPEVDPVTFTVPDWDTDVELGRDEIAYFNQASSGTLRDSDLFLNVDPIESHGTGDGMRPGFRFGDIFYRAISQKIGTNPAYFPSFILQSDDQSLTSLIRMENTSAGPATPLTGSALTATFNTHGSKTFQIPLFDTAIMLGPTIWSGSITIRGTEYWTWNQVWDKDTGAFLIIPAGV